MFNKVIKNKKRAVSPVIAVVLLIALTVAATAIIWGVTSGFFDTQASVTVTTTSTGGTAQAPTWTGTITVSSAGDLSDVTFNDGTVAWAMTPTTNVALVKGANSVTIIFAGTPGAIDIILGTYDLAFSFTATGSEAQSAGEVSATFS